MVAHHNPVFGIESIPIRGFQLRHPFRMSIREILARNVAKLRNATPSLRSPKDLVASGAVTNGTLGRISNRESGATIDTVEALAAAYGLEAWQLLVPTLEATPGRDGRPAISGMPQWPFELVDQDRYERLSDLAKGACQMRMMDEIESQELRGQNSVSNG